MSTSASCIAVRCNELRIALVEILHNFILIIQTRSVKEDVVQYLALILE